jgi:hypothetical protein
MTRSDPGRRTFGFHAESFGSESSSPTKPLDHLAAIGVLSLGLLQLPRLIPGQPRVRSQDRLSAVLTCANLV